MSLKTLPWCPQPGYTVDEEPKRKVLNFGNGYQQRMASSLTICELVECLVEGKYGNI